jgi:hypothetical protein
MIFVQALLVGVLGILEVIISAEALQFPVGRDRYLIPGTAFLSCVDKKLPVYGMIFIRSGEIYDLISLSMQTKVSTR